MADEYRDECETPPMPTAVEIARRSIALYCTICAAHGVSKEDMEEWLREENLWDALTPRELKFFKTKPNPRQEVIWMSWMVEAQVALLWSIGKLSALPSTTEKCDTGAVVDAMPGLFASTSDFISSSVLRSRDEIEREESAIYDIHVEVDQARLHQREIRGGHDKDVAFFRHYGMCWLRGYGGQEWDKVTPDT